MWTSISIEFQIHEQVGLLLIIYDRYNSPEHRGAIASTIVAGNDCKVKALQLKSTTARPRDAGNPVPDRRLRVQNTRRGTSDRGRTHHGSRNQPPNAQRTDANGKSGKGKKTECIVSWHD